MVNYTELARGLEPFLMKLIKDVVGDQKATAVKIGSALNAVILYDTSLGNHKQFAISQAGFTSALAAGGAGDVIFIPPTTIAGDHTITAGVRVHGLSRYASIFSGTITGGAGSSIENLSIIQSADSADNLIGVDSPASGTFYINDCDIEVTQAGAGNAYGLNVGEAGTIIEVWNSFVFGASSGGDGYSAFHSAGSAYYYGGRAFGSTATFNVLQFILMLSSLVRLLQILS